MKYPNGSVRVVIAVAIRPWLWRAALRFCPSWRHPLPPPEYVRFRMQTMYGGAGDRAPEGFDLVDDAIRFLYWARRTHRSRNDGLGGGD